MPSRRSNSEAYPRLQGDHFFEAEYLLTHRAGASQRSSSPASESTQRVQSCIVAHWRVLAKGSAEDVIDLLITSKE